MSAPVWIGIALAGGAGAVCRFALDGFVSERARSELPWGTFAVNVLGAFLLGLLNGLDVADDAVLVAGTGLLGSFTTFSTWMFESHRLGEDGELTAGAANVAVSLLLGLGAAAAGRAIGGAL